MSQFRLHLDCPLGTNQEEAIANAKNFLERFKEYFRKDVDESLAKNFQFRLANDDDRGRKNYLIINENGHAANKKSKL